MLEGALIGPAAKRPSEYLPFHKLVREKERKRSKKVHPPHTPRTLLQPQLNVVPLVAECLILINGEGETFNFVYVRHQHGWGGFLDVSCDRQKDNHEIKIAVISQHDP